MTAERRIRRLAAAHEDDRGRIVDLFIGERFDAITHVSQRKGAIRGDHFHRETLQIAYVIRGRLRVITQMPGEAVRVETAEAGDLIQTPPVVRHAFVALEDAEFVVFARGPRAATAYESDTYRPEDTLLTPDRVDPA